MAGMEKKPITAKVWVFFGVLVAGALLSFGVAVLLGQAERGVEHTDGYVQVVRGEKAPVKESEEGRNEAAARDLAVLMQGGEVAGVSGTEPARQPAAAATDNVPMDVPVLPEQALKPTELPPEEGAKAEVFPHQTVSPLEVVQGPAQPLWQAHAVSVTVPAGAPMMALVIDDMGGDMAGSRKAVEVLPAGVTLSFFPWSREGVALAHEARQAGHEIMIHMPMEALPHGDLKLDPGPDTLRVGMTPAEIASLMARNVARLDDIAVGMNNHMGSRFTQWPDGMRAVLTVLQKDGMLFLDSKTSAPTAVQGAAKGLDLPVLSRDVFLDHTDTVQDVRHELARAVELARKNGRVIVIGHPLPVTLAVLQEELPQVVSGGIVLVPLTALVKP